MVYYDSIVWKVLCVGISYFCVEFQDCVLSTRSSTKSSEEEEEYSVYDNTKVITRFIFNIS